MAPFPEAEDMTIKRLYVALKRSDMQLLQMGAHKLHEKYHTGHKFELLDDLRQILAYVEEQNIPNDVKDLLTRTINDILNGEAPKEEFTPFEEEQKEDLTATQPYNAEEETQQGHLPLETNFEQDVYSGDKADEEPVIFTPKEEKSPIDIIYPEAPSANIIENTVEENKEESRQEDFAEPQQNYAHENIKEEAEEPIQEENILIQEETKEETAEKQNEDYSSSVNTPVQDAEPAENGSFSVPIFEPEQKEEQQNEIILEEKESTLENVAVFYDDKATVIDYMQNKLYRLELDSITLSKEAHPENSAAVNKSLVDTPTDEIAEILKMLNTIKGDVYFVTTSKSENIIKTFIGNGIDFTIPLVNEKYVDHKAVVLLPLYGLSNVLVCPKCGAKEYFGGFHNKVIAMQCKECSSVMYPDIYEADNYQTNANPYYWIKAMNSMAKADTWILINPPLENNRGLTAEFLKSSFEVAHPKKVYILSKETTKKEYYKQLFKEIYPTCDVKCDYIMQDELCEDFINNEMATLKVNI